MQAVQHVIILRLLLAVDNRMGHHEVGLGMCYV